MKNFEKRERGRIQGLPKIFGYLLLSQEREKLDFKFGQYIQRVHPNKSHRTINIDRVVRTAKPKLVDVGVVSFLSAVR